MSNHTARDKREEGPMKYEYLLVPYPKGPQNPANIAKALNQYGQMGWELAVIDYGCWILKRIEPGVPR